MIKIMSIFLFLFLSFSANADKDILREIMKETYPELPIKGIKKTDFDVFK